MKSIKSVELFVKLLVIIIIKLIEFVRHCVGLDVAVKTDLYEIVIVSNKRIIPAVNPANEITTAHGFIRIITKGIK